MPITSYCRKCAMDVPRGEACPRCGGKLQKSAARVAWALERRPARDWMCWNAALRVIVPAAAAVLLLILLMEGIAGGGAAVQALLMEGLLTTWGILCAVVLGALWLILALQGPELMDCVVDGRGVHVTTWLVDPTPLQLIARMQSAARLREAVPGPQGRLLKLETREMDWKEMSRVQLWPEKVLVLFYAPSWWMRLVLPCSALEYDAVLEFMRDKVGRRKDLLLPEDIKAAPKPRQSKVKKAAPKSEAPETPLLNETEARDMQSLLDEMREHASEQKNEELLQIYDAEH